MLDEALKANGLEKELQ